MPLKRIAHLGATSPLQRPLQPEQLARACVYLASDTDASATIRELVAVTGGLFATR